MMSGDVSASTAAAGARFSECSALDTSDTATALLALMIQSRGVQSDAARENVNHANDLIEQARRQIQDAMARAAEADDHAGFWDEVSQVFGGDVTAIAEVIASAALIAATGGTGAPAILALVAAGLSVGSEVGERLGLDPKLCAGLALTGGIAGLVTGNLTGASSLWQTLAEGAKVAQGAAAGVGAGAHIAASGLHADALDQRSDATFARGTESDAQLRFNLALGELAKAARELERGATVAASVVQSEHDGRTALIARLGAV
jgi:hypothetical protein